MIRSIIMRMRLYTASVGGHDATWRPRWSSNLRVLLMIGRPRRDPALIRQIKDWAYECLPISAEATVTVMELECREPGCPPLETVVAAIEQEQGTRQWKLHKAMPDITLADVVELGAKNAPARS